MEDMKGMAPRREAERAAGSGPIGPAAALLLAVLVSLLPAETPTDKEYRVKAVFLYNFAQFVDWPDSAFPGEESPLVVGVLGSDPFHEYLDEVVRGEKAGNRPIEVIRYRRVEDVEDCHVLFVSASESPRLGPILERLKRRNILTVGESEPFSRMGGMVSFVNRRGKIRLKINLDAVQAADLSVSSKLLRLAEIVPPGKGG